MHIPQQLRWWSPARLLAAAVLWFCVIAGAHLWAISPIGDYRNHYDDAGAGYAQVGPDDTWSCLYNTGYGPCTRAESLTWFMRGLPGQTLIAFLFPFVDLGFYAHASIPKLVVVFGPSGIALAYALLTGVAWLRGRSVRAVPPQQKAELPHTQ
jgi:hypothetical protein